MKYDLKKRIFFIKKFYETGSIKLVQRAYQQEFSVKIAPHQKVIRNVISTFEKTGSVVYQAPKSKEPSQKRIEVQNQLEKLVINDPTLSTRKAAVAIGVSQTMILNVLHDDLHFKPYKYQQWHRLEVHDYEKRVDFAQWFLSLPQIAKFFFICCDEAYFYLTLPVNKQNNRNWLQKKPFEGIEIPLQDEKILVWCAISAERVFGPYYFEESVNQYNYLEMLKTFFWPKVLRTASYDKYYFQQDGATPHTATAVQEWLSDKFLKKFVDKKKWPPRSPDLNPCDYFLWGHLKSVVYNPLPKTLEDLKANLEREIKKISKETLNSVFFNLKKRCEKVILAEGGHIEDK